MIYTFIPKKDSLGVPTVSCVSIENQLGERFRWRMSAASDANRTTYIYTLSLLSLKGYLLTNPIKISIWIFPLFLRGFRKIPWKFTDIRVREMKNFHDFRFHENSTFTEKTWKYKTRINIHREITMNWFVDDIKVRSTMCQIQFIKYYKFCKSIITITCI